MPALAGYRYSSLLHINTNDMFTAPKMGFTMNTCQANDTTEKKSMGLDIKAYKNVKLVENPVFDDHGDITHPENNVKIYGSDVELPWVQADDLEVGQVYEYEGCLSGYSSAYSAYSTLRDELARIAGYEYHKDLDGHRDEQLYLAELTLFSDCEGEIDTKTCRKILADLIHAQKLNDAQKGKVDGGKPLDPCNEGLLDDLVTTFVYAAQDGFVQFE